MAKQIMNVRDVMAVLEVSESKAYGVIRQLNGELSERGFITQTSHLHKCLCTLKIQ